MPLSKQPGQFGNLQLSFKIKFPKNLTPDERQQIASIL